METDTKSLQEQADEYQREAIASANSGSEDEPGYEVEATK